MDCPELPFMPNIELMTSLVTLEISGSSMRGVDWGGIVYQNGPFCTLAKDHSLAYVTLPYSYTALASDAFRECIRLQSIGLPGVTSIGDRAFYGCNSLKFFEMPANVTSIPYRAFFRCSSLISAGRLDNITSIGDDAFCYCTSLKSLDMHPGMTKLGDGAFFECSGLVSVTGLDNVTTIGEAAFNSCTSLTSINIPRVDSITGDTFHGCSNLGSINADPTSIGYAAFYACSKLFSICIPRANSFGTHSFQGCKSLAFLTISAKAMCTYTLSEATHYNQFSACNNLSTLHFTYSDEVNNINLKLLLIDNSNGNGGGSSSVYKQITYVDLKNPDGSNPTGKTLTIQNCGGDGVEVVLDESKGWTWRK
jgi:hypothetical protein